jgi:hypothetical protein
MTSMEMFAENMRAIKKLWNGISCACALLLLFVDCADPIFKNDGKSTCCTIADLYHLHVFLLKRRRSNAKLLHQSLEPQGVQKTVHGSLTRYLSPQKYDAESGKKLVSRARGDKCTTSDSLISQGHGI